MSMRYNRTDDDGHKFCVPDELLKEFDRLDDLISEEKWGSDKWYDLVAEFNDKFDKYNQGR
jgi:hypothetical protein